MASKNQRRAPTARTHEGAPTHALQSPMAQLRRATLACLLWEDTFYEDGESVSDRIRKYVRACRSLNEVADFAVELRQDHNLRHVPLLIIRELARHPQRDHMNPRLRTYIPRVVQRADELAELLAIYWADGRTPLAAQLKRGLADAFPQFNEYKLAKWNKDKDIKLRDVMFLTHPKPEPYSHGMREYEIVTQRYNRGARQVKRDLLGQGAVWRRLAADELRTPDTWETNLSAGIDKHTTFTRLLAEGKMGAMALLRNLRNMQEAGVDRRLITSTLATHKGLDKVLPFRYLSAMDHAPAFTAQLENAMLRSMQSMEKLRGTTFLLVDVSGSMDWPMAGKSELTRQRAAEALAILARGICEDVRVFAFADWIKEVPAYQGLALVDAIRATGSGGTYLGAAIHSVNQSPYDRIIVFTDEQSADKVPAPRQGTKGYMINVATYKNGVGYGSWNKIDGFSEQIINYIHAVEKFYESL